MVVSKETLDELESRRDKIVSDHEKYLERERIKAPNKPLIQLFDSAHDMDNDWTEPPCVVCDL